MAAMTFEREKHVDLQVTQELLPDLIEHLPLLNAKLVGTRSGVTPGRCIAELVVGEAPAEAAEMNPIFARYSDGTVVLRSIKWFRANGTWITTSDYT
jgi:hypothetical protein